MPKRRLKSKKLKGKRHATARKKAAQPAKLTAKAREPKAVHTSSNEKFKPEYVEMAKRIAVLGATDRELGEIFGTTERTFNRWKIAHPELVKALKVGKDVPDQIVIRSLFNRAKGYSFDSEELFVDKFGVEHRMECVKHVPPDVTACIFWLKNRDSENWRDRQEHVHELVTTPEQIRMARERAGLLTSVVAEQGERAAA